jgi:beta-lactamase class A
MDDLRGEIERLAQACGGTVSVCVRDVSNAFDFSLNEGARVGAASTIKVPTLVEAVRQVKEGRLSLGAEYTLRGKQRCGGSGVISHLHEDVLLTLQDLLTLMIIVSDNTATNAVIDIVGMDNVNSTLRSFGYTGTALMRRMYDWEAMAQGRDNYVVAEEMADLLARIARREAVGPEWDDLVLAIMRNQLFSDELGLFLPEGVLANKTGQRGTVVNDCGIVTTDRFCYSIAVFTQDTECFGETKIAIGRISKAVYDAAGRKSCG